MLYSFNASCNKQVQHTVRSLHNIMLSLHAHGMTATIALDTAGYGNNKCGTCMLQTPLPMHVTHQHARLVLCGCKL